jgi:ubiquitin carboxyl-terminal hydrolase 8
MHKGRLSKLLSTISRAQSEYDELHVSLTSHSKADTNIFSVAANIPKHADWPKLVQQRGPTYYRYQDFIKNVPEIIQRGHRLEELLKAREDARAQEVKHSLQEQQQKPFVEEDMEGAVGGTDAQDTTEGFSNSLANRLSALRLGTVSASDSGRRASVGQAVASRNNLSMQSSQVASSSSRQLPDSPLRAPPDLPTASGRYRHDSSASAPITDDRPMHFPTESEFATSYPTLDDFEQTHQRTDRDGAGRDTPSRPLPVAPPKPASLASRSPVASTSRQDLSIEDFFPLINPGFHSVDNKMVRKAAPKVLLLDVRPRSQFEARRIKGVDTVCVEPSILLPGITSEEISSRLQLTASKAEMQAFDSRDTYDVVVLSDLDSRTMTEELNVLYRAVFDGDYNRPLRAAPRLLVGGIDRWWRKVGEDGVVGSGAAVTSNGSNGDLTSTSRSKRQAVYIPGGTTSAALRPEGGFEQRAGPGFDHPSTPSMPARTYSSSKLGTPPMQTAPTYAHQPHIPSYHSPSQGNGNGTFDYPQLAYQAQQHRQSPYSSPLIGTLAPTAPAAVAGGMNGFNSRPSPSLDSNRSSSMDIARRPAVPPPGGTPFAVQARPLSTLPPRIDKSSQVRVGMTGLKNVGNSCYMNSTLQCLSATIPLSRFLLDGSYRKAINRVNPLGTQGALAEAFAQLIRVMWSEQYTFVSPVTFREAITRFAPAFRGYDQHDAQEFLAFLLDGLHEDLNYVKQKPPALEMSPAREEELETLPQQIASVQEWEVYRERNNSLIVDWFQGQFRNKLTCLTCGKTSTTYNAFLYLSLPIPATGGRGGKVTLAQCLDAFTKDEILEKADAWHCPRCKKPRRATKKLTISRLPQILLIHLKRFSFKGPFTDKIETLVQFPTTNLDLTNYMPPPVPPGTAPRGTPVGPFVYDLYGATHHFGSLTGGHYTATIRTQGEHGQPQWMYCDDSRITKSDERQIHSPSSYILWWNRKER